MKRAIVVTMTALFSALSIILTVLKFEVPYPLLPYLKFDFAEIPTVIAYFTVNPYSGFVCSVLHWFFLMYRSGDVLGPSMKFAAVVSMLFGFKITSPLLKRFSSDPHLAKYYFVFPSCVAGFIRIVVMSIFNVIVLLWIAPGYLGFASYLLQSVLGYLPNSDEALYWTLIFTGVYNGLHVAFSIVPAILLLGVLRGRFRYLKNYVN